MKHDKFFEEMPTPCPRCGEVFDHRELKPSRTAASKVLQIAFRGHLLCPKCHSIKKASKVHLA